jgi:hypothetical protein
VTYPHFRSIHEGNWANTIAYSIFFLESAQTVLSGADLYYWFVEGFGDDVRLGNYTTISLQ